MPGDIVIVNPAPPAVVQELSGLVATASNFPVIDKESHAVALERVRDLRRGEKKIEEYFEPSRKAADAARKEILRARDGLIAPIAAARAVYDRSAQAYEAAERERAAAEQRRLQDEARKQEEERALLEAVAAEADGDAAGAEAILQQPVSVPTITVAPAIAKVDGVSTRTLWSAEVVDLEALVAYVAAHPEWSSLLDPNMPNLNRLAVAQREALSIPGVRAIATISRATR